jgi:hypothetical protein
MATTFTLSTLIKITNVNSSAAGAKPAPRSNAATSFRSPPNLQHRIRGTNGNAIGSDLKQIQAKIRHRAYAAGKLNALRLKFERRPSANIEREDLAWKLLQFFLRLFGKRLLQMVGEFFVAIGNCQSRSGVDLPDYSGNLILEGTAPALPSESAVWSHNLKRQHLP